MMYIPYTVVTLVIAASGTATVACVVGVASLLPVWNISM